jgi:RNase_H superfamily
MCLAEQPPFPMLTFDIETTGLDKENHLITVVSLYDPNAAPPIDVVFRFTELDSKFNVVYRDSYMEHVTLLVKYLNEADKLCGFNSIAFDVPFIAKQFKIPSKTSENWKRKIFDVYAICSNLKQKRTFNLNLALELNGFSEVKTGDGLRAVTLAKEGKWKELEDYCRVDTRLTHALSSMPTICCPESYKWRQEHNGQTHDPSRVLQINTATQQVSYGPLPVFTTEKTLGKHARGGLSTK